MHTIIDTGVETGSFKILAAAVTAAGLVDTLNGIGPFTVFAPTKDAFAKLPAGKLESLLADVTSAAERHYANNGWKGYLYFLGISKKPRSKKS